VNTSDSEARPAQAVARELAASSGFLLARLGHAFKARAIATLEAAGFELYDYSFLALLAEGVRERQSAMADALALDPSRLVALLDSLERRGLVARQRDPDDRRRHVVRITGEGKQALARLREMSRTLEDEFLAPLDQESRQVFHECLLRLAVHNDASGAFGPGGESSEN
jgi:DNA-binding MarR family transcriptional regulator